MLLRGGGSIDKNFVGASQADEIVVGIQFEYLQYE